MEGDKVGNDEQWTATTVGGDLPVVGGWWSVVGGRIGAPLTNRERLSDKEEMDARRDGAKMIPSSTRSPTVGSLLWGETWQVR